jgi:hypothetical protein
MRTRSALFALGAAALVGPACQVIEWNFYFVQAASSSTTTSSSTTSMLLCAPGATQACYDGPADTEGVGICKAGEQTCATDGASWGPCAGAVLPLPIEDCASGRDQNCDGHVTPCTGALLWAKQFGDTGNHYAASLAIDGDEDVLVTGNFSGSITFGASVFSAAGSADAYLAKLDGATGSPIWGKHLAGAGTTSSYGIAVATDPSGDVIVAGSFAGTVDFGGGPLTSSSPGGDVFLLKLDPAGNHVWSRRYGGTLGQTAAAIAVDASGAVFLLGNFYGAINFGGGSLQSAGQSDVFLAKLDASGSPVWSKRFGDGGNQAGYGLAVDASGAVLVLANGDGAIDFGGGPLQGAGGSDVFLAKLGADGAHAWSSRFGDSADQIGYAVAADPSGGAVITGALWGSADFGGGSLSSAADADVFVARFDATGGHIWSKRLGGAAQDVGYAVATDAAGNVALTGTFGGTVDFGTGPLASAGLSDVFILKLDAANGLVKWARRAGGTKNDTGSAVRETAAGEVVAAGSFSGVVDFGGITVTSTSGDDIFVAKLSP